jgi:hypothetical protein
MTAKTLWIHLIFTTASCLITQNLTAQNLVRAKDGNLIGYKDSTRSFVIKPQYRYARNFVKGYAVAAVKDSLGAIDESNNIVMPFKYEYPDYLGEDLFTFGCHGKYFGEFIIGVTNKAGRIIIKPAYQCISFANKTYLVSKSVNEIGTSGGNDVRAVNNLYGVLDEAGNELIPCQYDWIKRNGNLFTVKQKNLEALFSSSGKQITPFNYMFIDHFRDGLAKSRVGDLFGYTDTTGKDVIPMQYKMCYMFTEGFAVVFTDKGNQLINKKGKIVFKEHFELLKIVSLGVLSARKGQKWGLINIKGKEVIPFEFDEIKRQFAGVIAIRQADKWAIFSSIGKQLTDFKYQDVSLLDLDENSIMDFSLSTTNISAPKQILVEQNNKWGVVDMQGKEIYPPEYSNSQMYRKLKPGVY